MAERVRYDMDDRAASFYRKQYGEEPPALHDGDRFTLPDYPSDVFIVVRFRAGGMLVDALRGGSTQELNFPRRYVPDSGGDSFYIERTG